MAEDTYIIRLNAQDNIYQVRVDNNQPQYRVIAENGQGPTGISAYQQALNEGFVGTEAEWIESLEGLSAYEVALNNGFVGTEQEWLDSLKQPIDIEPQNSGKILSNDGSALQWQTLEYQLNTNTIHWDLGYI